MKKLMYFYGQLKEEIKNARKANQFFTGIMYEYTQLLPEQEDLAQTLYTLLYQALIKEFRGLWIPKTYKLYLECRFGDPFKPRIMPSTLALKFRPQLVEEAYMQRQLEQINRSQETAEEFSKQTFKNKSSQEDYVKRITSEQYKNSQLEEAAQYFRSYFRPSEVVVYNYHIAMKIPEETPRGAYLAKIFLRPEEKLPSDCLPHVFTQEEITEIVKLCEEEITEYIQASETSSCLFTAIDEMFDFFNLLSQPENHIKVPSGQYVEKHVNVRPVHDMTNEIAQELGKLPRFQAYIKLIDEVANKQVVRTHRIQTHPLPEIQSMETESQAIANGHTLGKKRDEIEAEIRERQKRWLPGSDRPTTRGR